MSAGKISCVFFGTERRVVDELNHAHRSCVDFYSMNSPAFPSAISASLRFKLTGTATFGDLFLNALPTGSRKSILAVDLRLSVELFEVVPAYNR